MHCKVIALNIENVLDQEHVHRKNVDYVSELVNFDTFKTEIRKVQADADIHYKTNLGFVLVNARSFAAVNDSLNHDVGDLVIKKYAEIIRQTIIKFCHNNPEINVKDFEIIKATPPGINYLVRAIDIAPEKLSLITKNIEEAILQNPFSIEVNIHHLSSEMRDYVIANGKQDKKYPHTYHIDLQNVPLTKKSGAISEKRVANLACFNVSRTEEIEAFDLIDFIQDQMQYINNQNYSLSLDQTNQHLGAFIKNKAIFAEQNRGIAYGELVKQANSHFHKKELAYQAYEKTKFISADHPFFENDIEKFLDFKKHLGSLQRIAYARSRGEMINTIYAFVKQNIRCERIQLIDNENEIKDPTLFNNVSFNNDTCEITLPIRNQYGEPLKKLAIIKIQQDDYEKFKNNYPETDYLFPIRIAVEQMYNIFTIYGFLDSLMNIPNATAYYEDHEKLFQAGQTYGDGFFDIDKYSGISQTFGRKAGDKILEDVGKITTYIQNQENYNQAYTTYRVGGEEFHVLKKGGGSLQPFFDNFKTALNQYVHGSVLKKDSKGEIHLEPFFLVSWQNIENRIRNEIALDENNRPLSDIDQVLAEMKKEYCQNASQQLGVPIEAIDFNKQYTLNILQLPRYVKKLNWFVTGLDISEGEEADITPDKIGKEFKTELSVKSSSENTGEKYKTEKDQQLLQKIAQRKKELGIGGQP